MLHFSEIIIRFKSHNSVLKIHSGFLGKSIPRFSIIFLFSFSIFFSEAVADEGMWIPLLLNRNIGDMQSKGLKLNAEDIYSINSSSLKDAIVLFGGGCTGELVSNEGLMLTNHHCGFDVIQNHSSLEHDYISNGFWAMNRSEELVNKGLTVTFLIRMEDVSARILRGVTDKTPETERNALIKSHISEIETEAIKGTHYQASVRPFYYGNEFYLFVTETFMDVRLVGAPPSSIGKFGGDTDNWMWPRHTGDFSIFRIYAGRDNNPASYSSDNVPYKPKKILKISTAGVKEGDFTMVYGFPGRTQQFITSYALDYIQNTANPNRINIRQKFLDIINAEMNTSPLVRIQYSSKAALLSNGWKKWIGENNGLKRLNALEQKRTLEANFKQWIETDESLKLKFNNLLPQFEKNYSEIIPYTIVNDYLSETFRSISYFQIVSILNKAIYETDKNFTEDKIARIIVEISQVLRDVNVETERKLLIAALDLIYKNIPKEFIPSVYNTLINKKYEANISQYSYAVSNNSHLLDTVYIKKMLKKSVKNIKKELEKDLAYSLEQSLMNELQKVLLKISIMNNETQILNRKWLSALRQMQSDRNFFPDANSTLRFAYGNVGDYLPRDGVKYEFQTSLEGIIEKDNPEIYDYRVPEKLKMLYKSKDYGPWGVNGSMPVAFIATNHTTGGNSGSPVLNGNGELIGINFDRVWEGTMSDLVYDPDQCRNISLDIRYLLFIVDKFAGANHLINELSLVN